MSKRSYADIKKNEEKFLEMKAAGFTNREIGGFFIIGISILFFHSLSEWFASLSQTGVAPLSLRHSA